MENNVIKKQSKKLPQIKFHEGLSKSSQRLYTEAVKRYFQYCEENNYEYGTKSVEEWLNSFRSANYYNLNKIALSKFFSKHYEKESPERLLELLTFFKNLPKKTPDNRIKEKEYLTKEQFDMLLKNVNKTSKKMALIIEALFWTGCRITELLNIQLSDCQQEGKVISIRVMGKGNKERQVYISAELFRRIKKEFNHSKTYLFETRNNSQFADVNISEYIRRAGKRVFGADMRISAHNLRHSKAMYLKDEMKLSPDQIAKALGHSSVITTLTHYFHGTPTAEEQGII